MAQPTRGKLIVFEGLDRAGKSSQCSKLVENLQKQTHKVRSIRFPDRTTPIGHMIDNYLKGESNQEDHVIHLLFSANRWEAAAKIEADINAGTTVVIDRYYYSGCVYSAAKNNPTLSLGWARRQDEGLPRPDICVFLDISPQIAAERGAYGAERYEKKEMQDRVRELFQVLRNSPEKDDFIVIDGGGSIEDVEVAVTKAVESAMRAVDADNRPLRYVEPW